MAITYSGVDTPRSLKSGMASILISCRAPCCPDSRSTLEPVTRSNPIRYSGPSKSPNKFLGSRWLRIGEAEQRINKLTTKVYAAVTITDDVQEYTIPTWSEFEIGQSPVYWETENGLPPTSGERLTIFYNPVASKLIPDSNYGIAFNGGFNQPIMCASEPRLMTKKDRGRVASPFYAIKIIVPKHALTLIFSFTDGVNWDGPYKIQFEIPSKWRNKPISFFNEGLATELSQEGACDKAIYPEENFVLDRCVFPAGLVLEGGDRCKLDLVPGCTDPESPFFDPLANVDDGSCPTFSDEAEEN